MKPFESARKHLGDLDAESAGGLISAAADVALIVDGDGVIRDMAFGSDELSKDGFESWLGRPWVETVTIESRPKVLSLLRDAATPSKVRWRQVNHALPQGNDLPLLYSAVSVGIGRKGGSLAVGRSVAFGRDLRATAALQQRLIDAQQAMERDYWLLRDAQTRYRHLFQVAAEAVVIVDAATGKVMEANPSAMQVLAESARKLVGSSLASAFDAAGGEAVQTMLAGVRAAGRPDDVRARLAAGGEIVVAASVFRQETGSMFVVRLSQVQRVGPDSQSASGHARLLRLVQSAPDCIVVTDMEGMIQSANAAFVDLAQLTTEEQVRGESLGRWIGRTGVDVSVLLSNLRQRGSVRLFATSLRGEYGTATDVEISATHVQDADPPFFGFTIRDVSRRLSASARAGKEIPRSVGQLSELVGRVPMKDIVGETTDLIEQLCIEAALELTRDNRAAAAEMLGLSRQSLYVKLRRYGMSEPVAEGEK